MNTGFGHVVPEISATYTLSTPFELKQLHDRDIMEPVHAHLLTREQRICALAYLMFLKEKCIGKVKGHGCADGQKQWVYKTKAEVSLPTVAIESVMISSAIDADEGCNVAAANVLGSFMQTGIDKEIHVQLDGDLADLMAKIDPDLYKKYIVGRPGKRAVLYAKLSKALYETLQAALLFWKDLSGTLIEWYELNPYNRCVANKMVNRKQSTVLWHVDGLKLLHVDSQ